MSQFNSANRRRRGWASVALLTALAGSAAVILIHHESGAKGVIAEPGCGGCQLPDGAKGGLIGRPGGKQGDVCLTQPIYEANRPPVLAPMAACPTMGPPDDPAIRDAAIPVSGTPVRTYRLYFHILRETGGGSPAATEANLLAAIASTNAHYAPWKIQFSYGFRYINDTKFRYMDTQESSQMKSKYALSPTTQLNIFITRHNQGGSWGTFPWDANSLTKYGGVVLDDRHLTTSGTVLSHEIGHCLGLWHTHHGVSEVAQCSDCYEPVGRSVADGDTKGDFCSDTQPTPTNGACNDPSGSDPCSGLPWSNTPWLNLMNYSLSCANEFTSQQAGRMHAWTTQTLSGWLELPPPPNAPGTPTLSNSGGTVTISWADNSPDESGFEVQREKKAKGNSWGSQTSIGTVGANETSKTDSPGPGTFRYRVRSFNGNGNSAWSAWSANVTL